MGIDIANDLAPLRARIAEWKRAGLRVGFVPTMGNLHAGHHSLVRLAREHADRVVASVFVNPTQFGPNEDFSRYPRTPEADAEGLAAAGCDLLWMPTVETMYPFGADGAVRIRVPGITDVLEGAHRPGHFDGVATVVARLFLQVQPDVAAFGRKDYQQLAVIRYLVRDLAFPIELLAGETLREADGLAMSSRNAYLTAEERRAAVCLSRVLCKAQKWVRRGETSAAAILQGVLAELGREPLAQVEYAKLCDAESLDDIDRIQGTAVLALAVRFGRARLIDNCIIKT